MHTLFTGCWEIFMMYPAEDDSHVVQDQPPYAVMYVGICKLVSYWILTYR